MPVNWRHILIPGAIFIGFSALYVVISLVTGSDMLFRPIWDIGHYQSIAESGYEVYPCDPRIHYPVGDYCGNVGWFPAWPLAVRILSFGQVSRGLLILPYLFALLGFILFYNILRRHSNDSMAVIGTAALASTPNAFYFLTGFPYSFMLVLFCAYILYLYNPEFKGRIYVLPAIAFLISLSYPSAFLTAVIPFVMVIRSFFRQRERSWARLVRNLGYHLAPFALGPFLLSLYFYFTFDDFLLILHFQEKYNRQWNFPFTVIWRSFVKYPLWYVENATLLYYGVVLLAFARYRVKPELAVYSIVFYLFSPTTGTLMSIYRHFVLIFPAPMIVGASRRPLWVKLLFILLGFGLSLWRFYPIFMKGRLI